MKIRVALSTESPEGWVSPKESEGPGVAGQPVRHAGHRSAGAGCRDPVALGADVRQAAGLHLLRSAAGQGGGQRGAGRRPHQRRGGGGAGPEPGPLRAGHLPAAGGGGGLRGRRGPQRHRGGVVGGLAAVLPDRLQVRLGPGRRRRLPDPRLGPRRRADRHRSPRGPHRGEGAAGGGAGAAVRVGAGPPGQRHLPLRVQAQGPRARAQAAGDPRGGAALEGPHRDARRVPAVDPQRTRRGAAADFLLGQRLRQPQPRSGQERRAADGAEEERRRAGRGAGDADQGALHRRGPHHHRARQGLRLEVVPGQHHRLGGDHQGARGAGGRGLRLGLVHPRFGLARGVHEPAELRRGPVLGQPGQAQAGAGGEGARGHEAGPAAQDPLPHRQGRAGGVLRRRRGDPAGGGLPHPRSAGLLLPEAGPGGAHLADPGHDPARVPAAAAGAGAGR